MREFVSCPYCGAKMESRELGLSKKIMRYECPKCLSCSPPTTNRVTANSMALMRGKHIVRKEYQVGAIFGK